MMTSVATEGNLQKLRKRLRKEVCAGTEMNAG